MFISVLDDFSGGFCMGFWQYSWYSNMLRKGIAKSLCYESLYSFWGKS